MLLLRSYLPLVSSTSGSWEYRYSSHNPPSSKEKKQLKNQDYQEAQGNAPSECLDELTKN